MRTGVDQDAQLWQSLEDQHSAGVYSKRPVVLVRGQGTRVWDADGKAYIDCATGIGVAAVGHANPCVAQAIAEQAQTLITCADAHFYNDKRAQLLHKLMEIAPGKHLRRVFLCNSGTEAVEAAIKFARGFAKRPGIIAAMRSFHGRTLGALSATWKEKYRKPFGPLIPGFSHVPFGDLQKLEEALNDETAAVLLEPVQGEGGVYPPPAGYLEAVRELCTRKGVLLILDEVQTGFGRTGRMFACEHVSVEPDILCLAKAMGGGMPIGATLLREDISLGKGLHGSTFGGNPLVCAAALATIEYIQQNRLPERAAERGAYFLSRLKELESCENVREARGLGLMLALQLRVKSGPYLLKLMERGILALPAGNTVIRFLPPLEITADEVDQVVAALNAVLRERLDDDRSAEEDA
jgi:acetylornithine/LysW-gamma-L-lysine aminotransferase